MKSKFLFFAFLLWPIFAWPAESVTGTVNYLQQHITLPTKAEVIIELQDISTPGTDPAVVASQHITINRQQAPIPFELFFDSKAIDKYHQYIVKATIKFNGKTLFLSDKSYPVMTNGYANHANLILSINPDKEAQAYIIKPNNLENTYWKLTSLDDNKAININVKRHPYLRFETNDKRVSATGGCNFIMGTYDIDGSKLKISSVALTMMACPYGMDIDTQLSNALQTATTFAIKNQQLILFDSKHHPVATFISES